MTIKFNQRVKHDRLDFFPGVALDIPGAEHYFIACGWASETTEEPVAVYDDVEFDPETRHGDTGKLVLEEAN